MHDPKRLYETLRVKPGASAREIAAAYRKLAKVLHPDVPGTGSAAEFMRVHQAYAVLHDPLERARYDRMARESGEGAESIWSEARWAAGRAGADAGVGAWASAHAGEADADLADLAPQPVPPRPGVRLFRLSTLAAAGAAALTLGAGWYGYGQMTRPRPVQAPAAAAARDGAPPAVAPPPEDPGAPDASATGAASYVLPADGQATFWRYDPGEKHYRPAGRLAAFTELRVLRLVPRSGMAEVRLADARIGYVEAHLVAAGDGEAAKRADCVYNAGAPPRNGEMLAPAPAPAPAPDAAGGGRPVMVENTGELPAVFALRSGATVAAVVYVQPHQAATIQGVAPGQYRPEYAIGDLWSRACFRFAAGMRTQRATASAPLAGRYAIPDPAASDVPGLAVGQASP